LREHNLSQILLALFADAPLSRAKIAERTGLGVTAMTKLIAELRERQLIMETTCNSSGLKGRPTSLVALSRRRWATASLSLDNGSITASIGDIDGSGVATFAILTPHSLEIDEYMNFVVLALERIARECSDAGRRVLALEVAVPGAVNSATGVMTRSILNGWRRPYPLRQTLVNILGSFESGVADSAMVGIDRATNYSMLARIRKLGGDQSIDSVAHLGALYAVSGGIYSRSAIEHGSSGLAGEFGHFVIDPAGELCWCGRRGCVETRIGLAGLYARCNEGADEASLVPQLARRHEAMVNELLVRARGGDKLVKRELEQAGYWLGITVDTIAAVVNPQVLIIDGYLSKLREFLEPEMAKQLASLGALPSIFELDIHFTENPFEPVNQGMQIAAAFAVACNPAVALG